MFSSKKETKNINFFNKFFTSPKKKRAVFFVFLAVLVFGSSFLFAINSSRAQATPPATPKTTTPAPQPMTKAQIQQISGWDNWDPSKPAPPGTKISDPITSGVDNGQPATYQLLPADQFTITSNVVAPVASAASAVGGAIGDAFATIVLKVVIGVLAVLAFFCKYLLMFAGWTLDATLNPNLYNFTSNTMITTGWTIVRDICNLFFLLVLLFIALCTILKIEKYHAKKTLLTLIIMALLINFSKPIAIFIFDGSQLLMNFFLNQFKSVNGQSPSTQLSTDIASFMYDKLKGQLDGASASMQIAVYYLFVVVFLFMFAVALFVTAIFLVIRIIAIMILIIVSPLAFFAAIVPDFSNMSSSWWSALFKYCYYGPAAAFFLLLAAKFATSNVLPHLNVQGNEMILQNIIQYLTVLVFLYASIIMSQQFGIAAAGAIVGNANRFMKWAPWAPYKGIRGAYRMSQVHDPMMNALKRKYPKLYRYATKGGRKEGAKQYWDEKFGNTTAEKKQQEAAAKHEKDMKDKNYTEKDFVDVLNKSADAAERMAAAMSLAKLGKLDFTQYDKAIKDFEKNPSFKKLFDSEVAKKNVHLIIDSEIKEAKTAAAKASRTMTQPEIDTIVEKHTNNLNPEQLAKQNVMDLINIENSHGSTSTRDMLLDLQTSTDPKKQKLFEKFYAELSPAERKKLESGTNPVI